MKSTDYSSRLERCIEISKEVANIHSTCGRQCLATSVALAVLDEFTTASDICGQPSRDARLLEAVENTEIIYYGPHPCDICGKGKIVRGSEKQGFGDIRLDYPSSMVYPNNNWTAHRCAMPVDEVIANKLRSVTMSNICSVCGIDASDRHAQHDRDKHLEQSREVPDA